MADPITTKIYNNQLKETYVKIELIGAPNGVAGLDANSRVALANMPLDVTPLVVDASTTTKGIVRLSNSYTGSNQTLAATEKALADGISSVRTFVTKSIIFSVATGNLTAGATVLNTVADWPTTGIYGIWLYKNGLYQNNGIDFTPDTLSKTIGLTTAATASDRYTVVFDMLLNGDTFGSVGFYNKTEIDGKLALKADINSPALTGTPTSPTNTTATNNSNQIATNQFVQNAFSYYMGGRKIVVSNSVPTGTFSKYDIWFETEF